MIDFFGGVFVILVTIWIAINQLFDKWIEYKTNAKYGTDQYKQ